MAVGNAEEAECADHHVQIDRLDVGAEHTFPSATLQDAIQPLDHAGVQAAQAFGLSQVLAVVDVLDAYQPDEIRMGFLIVEGELDDAPHRIGRRQTIQVEFLFHAADVAIGLFQSREVQAFLAAEVIVDHPLVGAHPRSDGIDACAAQPVLGEFLAGGRKDLPAGAFRVGFA